MLRTMQGFKDFILRGNVIDLAVGIVIGAAFTALVTSFTTSFIEPLINLAGPGSGDENAGVVRIGGQAFRWAAFLNAVITFLIVALVLYFLVVLPMNRLAKRRKEGTEPEPDAPGEEVRLLTEIRDALRGADGPATASGSAAAQASATTADPTGRSPHE